MHKVTSMAKLPQKGLRTKKPHKMNKISIYTKHKNIQTLTIMSCPYYKASISKQ